MRVRLCAVAVWSLFCFVPLSFACTCGRPNLPPGKISMRDLVIAEVSANGQAQTIFEGTVERQEISSGPIGPPESATSMTPSGIHRIVTIRASRVYRGVNEQNFTVITGLGSGDCGFDFRTGESYLVFATQIESNLYFTSICTGTNLLEHSSPAVRFLRGEAPSAEDLLDVTTYYERMRPQWTGTICGNVIGPDGSPVKNASIELSEVREPPYPPNGSGEPSSVDGSFCIKNLTPGRYLLSAEKYDFDKWTRLMGFYPGVSTHANAVPIEIKPQTSLTVKPFALRNEKLYDIRISVVTSDGSRLPWERLGVAIQSADRDPLAYHEDHGVDEDGSYRFGYIPAGHYTVLSYAEPDFSEDKPEEQPFNWTQDKREIDVTGHTEVLLKIVPTN
jgi:hypothetical protein